MFFHEPDHRDPFFFPCRRQTERSVVTGSLNFKHSSAALATKAHLYRRLFIHVIFPSHAAFYKPPGAAPSRPCLFSILCPTSSFAEMSFVVVLLASLVVAYGCGKQKINKKSSATLRFGIMSRAPWDSVSVSGRALVRGCLVGLCSRLSTV